MTNCIVKRNPNVGDKVAIRRNCLREKRRAKDRLFHDVEFLVEFDVDFDVHEYVDVDAHHLDDGPSATHV